MGGQNDLHTAITIHGPELKESAVGIARREWARHFGVLVPKNLPTSLDVPVYNVGDCNRVLMHMCSRGHSGCHVVILNGRSGDNCEDHIHSANLSAVRKKLEGWAQAAKLDQIQTFWFVASGISRFGELCLDPKLDWVRLRSPSVILI